MGAEARTLTERNAEELAEWCGGKAVIERDALDFTPSPGINVPVGKGLGVKRASLGDIIIRKDDGTFEVARKI